jgi:hypothetical protein
LVGRQTWIGKAGGLQSMVNQGPRRGCVTVAHACLVSDSLVAGVRAGWPLRRQDADLPGHRLGRTRSGARSLPRDVGW